MRRWFLLLAISFCAGAIVADTDPWRASDVVQPSQVAKETTGPLIIHVGFPVLYRSVHITDSIYAGPGSESKGISDLKKAVQGQPRDREIILYCGCCPWDKCPNIRPAYSALHQLGYTNVKVMQVDTNLKTDWIDRGYPTQKHADADH